MKRLGPIALFLISLGGCSSDRPMAQTKTEKRPYQRFVPIPSASPYAATMDVSLDTKTGQVCRTWDWEVADAKSGSRGEAVSNLPKCIELYTKYPDSKE